MDRLSWSVGGGGFDLADDRRGFIEFDDDLVGDLSAMNLDFPWEVECDAHSFAFDRRDANNADGVLRVADDDFFAFSSCDY